MVVHLLLNLVPGSQKWFSICRNDDGGCHRGIGIAVAGVTFGLLEEGTNVYFTIYFEKSVTVAFKAAEKYFPTPLRRITSSVLRKGVSQIT